ncbi:DUF2867 domain-containing protein [Streptomyces zagrosensis]|uniref:DUF2867 domain-containing protein n=1 Tax=Streptomyces zagrosensis TaxID=1042984 RepID=A0A7W9V2Y2_9ACTN|nr:DUF2867 domain-containing protein [Streptomyces zagrosensis]MBB5939344.1 hypothetical protein [Streptomyces zagrosensis]
MAGPTVRRDAEPVTERAVSSLGGYDHVSTVAVDVPPDRSAVHFTQAMMSSPPGWVVGLMKTRDKLVKPFGLKVGHVTAPKTVKSGERLGPMRVLTVSDDEVMAGKDDKHLSYRCVFVVREGKRGPEGVCTTVVRYHRPAGRMYFRTIEPFHHMILAGMAKRGAA